MGLPIPMSCLLAAALGLLISVPHPPGQDNWFRYGPLIQTQQPENFLELFLDGHWKRSIFIFFYILDWNPWQHKSGAKPHLFGPCGRSSLAGGKIRPPSKENQSSKGAQWQADPFNDGSLETGCHLHPLISQQNLFSFLFGISLLELCC